jgi:flavin-dependent dehydrogenase
MPRGLARLRDLGVLATIDRAHTHRIAGIRYFNEDGASASALLPNGGGLGIRRVALSDALWRRAAEVGVELHAGHAARWLGEGRVRIGAEAHEAELVVAADGLRSAVRRQAGLSSRGGRVARFGVRQHFHVAPWTDHVEISFCEEAEAYVTPVGPTEVGVAFLWTPSRRRDSFASLLARFPALAARLRNAEPMSRAVGLGPMAVRVRRVTAPGLALLGDAAGYVDAITGEGISLGLETAHARCDVIVAGAPLREYARAHAFAFLRYATAARFLLLLARRPRLRRRVVAWLGDHPAAFAAAVRRFV